MLAKSIIIFFLTLITITSGHRPNNNPLYKLEQSLNNLDLNKVMDKLCKISSDEFKQVENSMNNLSNVSSDERIQSMKKVWGALGSMKQLCPGELQKISEDTIEGKLQKIIDMLNSLNLPAIARKLAEADDNSKTLRPTQTKLPN